MKHIRLFIAVAVTAMSAFAGFAADKVWTGTVNLTGDYHDYDNIQLNGTVVINVTKGTYYLNGAISDKPGTVGKIIKIGGGKLQFRYDDCYLKTSTKWPGPNTYTGGFELRAGSVTTKGSATSGTVQEDANPFGYGQITLDFTGSTKPTYDYMGTITNSLVMNGDSTDGGWFLNRGGGTGISGRPSLLKGQVYIREYYQRPDGTGMDGKMGVNGVFIAQRDSGDKCDVFVNGGTMLRMNGKVICRTLDAYQRFDSSGKQICNYYYSGMFGGFSFRSGAAGSDIDTIRINQGALAFEIGNCCGTPGVEFYGGLDTVMKLTSSYGSSWPAGKEVTCGYISLNTGATASLGHTFKWLKSDYRDDTEPYYVINASGGGADLTLCGEADTTAVCYFKVSQGTSITVDSPASFTQVFSNRTQRISRLITVKGGTLAFEDCPFENFNTFAVSDGGTLRFRNCDFSASEYKLFTKMKELNLDGTLEVYGSGAADTLPDSIAIRKGVLRLNGFEPISNTVTKVAISEGGSFDLPSGSVLAVNELTVDGERRRDGDYTDLGSGVTIQVRGAVFPIDHEAIWEGRGVNTFITTEANWQWDEVPIFNDTLKAIFAKGGEEARLMNDTTFGAIVITNAADDTKTTFTLAGNGERPEDTKLTLYGSMSVVGDTAALRLSNITIATPYGYDQGAPVDYGDKTVTIVSSDTSRYHLFVSNAVIEKPVWFRGNVSSSTPLLYVEQNSINEFKGMVYKKRTRDAEKAGNWSTWTVDTNAQLTFSNGFTTDYKSYYYVYKGSSVIIKNKPWTSQSENGCLDFRGGYLQLAASDNFFGYDSATNRFQDGLLVSAKEAGQTCFLDLTANYALMRSKLRLYSSTDRYLYVDLHCTTQKVLQLWYSGSNGPSTDQAKTDYITGEEGALLEVENKDNYMFTSEVYVNFRGGVGIHKLGPGSLTLKRGKAFVTAGLNNDHQSTGPLILEAGTLTLDEGVTWRNAQRVDISGGEFRVNEDLALGRNSILNLTGGKIYVPKGKTLWFSSVIINGETVADGSYTVSTAGNPFADYLTPDFAGTIRVCQRGYIILYR